MIVYPSTEAKFKKDVMTNVIGGIIYDAYQAVTKRKKANLKSPLGFTPCNTWIEFLMPKRSQMMQKFP